MSKEHKTLTEFFSFLVNKQENFQLRQEDAEDIIQDYYNLKNEQIEELKEEKRVKGLKKLALIVQKREERENQARIKAQFKAQQQVKVQVQVKQVIPNTSPNTNMMRPKVKAIKEMQALIDRIRN
ncbi:hypothetical protein [Labilibaculum antarcticum]|uniref:Uncharacterized protein n=1 Tax=Labilibaculum antarcticum TaxID=1717717 RepID=A0A1Y1CNR0_9BACT|nr:hypothetical protein [Labilibaculum antarcticum]BAX82046.1 hypothetical protein ALGA_3754 [Labilibaculum antarcticum]